MNTLKIILGKAMKQGRWRVLFASLSKLKSISSRTFVARGSGFFANDENMSKNIGSSIEDSMHFPQRAFRVLSGYAYSERTEAKCIPHVDNRKNLNSIARMNIFDHSVAVTRAALTKDCLSEAVMAGVPALRLERHKHRWMAGEQNWRKCALSIFMVPAEKTELKIAWLRDFNRVAAIAP